MLSTEIFRLVVAIVLSPVVASIGYKVRVPKARLGLGIGYAAMVVGFSFEVTQHIGWHALQDLAEHGCYTIAGISLLLSALSLKKQIADSGEVSA